MKNSKLQITIDQIKITNRFRKDLGNVNALAKSINTVGLMHPIVINENKELIAGQRRLEACKLLGWKEVPVTTINIKEIMAGELHENIARKDLTMSERIAILEEIEKHRIGHRISKKERVANCTPFQDEHRGKKTRSIVADLTGISERQLSKEKLIIKAAQADIIKFGPIVQKN